MVSRLLTAAIRADTEGVGLASYRLRANWRADVRAWAGSIIVLTLAGAAAITAATAARRTDTAFNRALREANAADVFVSVNAFVPDAGEARHIRATGRDLLDQLAAKPEVAAAGRYGGANVYRVADGRIDERLNTGSALGYIFEDDVAGRAMSRFRFRAGRLPDPARTDEVTINSRLATITGWRVGQVLDGMREFEPKDYDPKTQQPDPRKGRALSLKVVGIATAPEDLIDPSAGVTPRMYLATVFGARYPDTVFYLNEEYRLKQGGAGLDAFRRQITRVNKPVPAIDLASYTAPVGEGLHRVNRESDPLVNGLWILAALAAFVGLLLASQSIGRVLRVRSDEHAHLRAMGADRRQRFGSELTTTAIAIGVSALFAMLLAFAFSPFTDVGAASRAEPHGGFTVNWAVTALGFGVMVVGALLVAIPSLALVARARALPGQVIVEGRDRSSRAADALARAGFGAPAVVGTRLALQPGRGRSATPVRSVLASLVVVIAAVTATVGFAVNLDRFVTSPHLYGWNWDVAIGSRFSAVIGPDAPEVLAGMTPVESVSGLTVGQVKIKNRVVPAIGIDELKGHLAPKIDNGHLPRADDEIVLGAKTMREAHARVGDAVDVEFGDKTRRMHVVAATTLPVFGRVAYSEAGLGVGALTRAALFPQAEDPSTPGGKYNYALATLPGSGSHAHQLRTLRAALAEVGCSDQTCVLTDQRPQEITGYRSARGLPAAVGITLVLLLVATLTHALLSTLRRRRSDFAILRALGCDRHQLAATMLWQVLVLTGSALLIGVPLGLLLERLAWNAFTHQLGVSPGIAYPVAFVALGAAAIVLLAWLLAVSVGWGARRVARETRLLT